MRPVRWKPNPGGTNLCAGALAHVTAERVRRSGNSWYPWATPPLVRPWPPPWWYGSSYHYGRGRGVDYASPGLPGYVRGRPCVRDGTAYRPLVVLGWVPDPA